MTTFTRPVHLVTVTTIATLVAWFALAAPAALAQLGDMGYRAIAVDTPRPLLTIMGEFSDQRFDTGHNASFYARLLFGDELGICCGSVAGRGGFFDENSPRAPGLAER